MSDAHHQEFNPNHGAHGLFAGGGQGGRVNKAGAKKVVKRLVRKGFTRTSTTGHSGKSSSVYSKGKNTITITKHGRGSAASYGISGIEG